MNTTNEPQQQGPPWHPGPQCGCPECVYRRAYVTDQGHDQRSANRPSCVSSFGWASDRLGHPLGLSGARLALTATLELAERQARRALCTMCIGVGQGIAMIIERV